jgi:hypothetical protein
MKISQIKIMTDTSKCNNYDDDDGVRQFTLLWLVDDRSAPTDAFSCPLKSKCSYVFLGILYFYNLDATRKGGTVQIILGIMLTNQNSVQEEMKSRWKLGRACHHSGQNLFVFQTAIQKYTYTEL